MNVDAVKTLEKLKPKFLMKRENNHKVQGMWMLLVKTAKSGKQREVWFIVNGVPIHYGLREQTLISRLNCCNYPLDYKKCSGTKFVKRHFKEGEPIRLEDVKEKLVKMGPHRDILKIGGYILAFKAIPKLENLFRVPVERTDVNCSRMCKSTFKPNGMKGMSLSLINKELGHDIMKDDVGGPDLEVYSWDKHMDEGLSVFFMKRMDDSCLARRTCIRDRKYGRSPRWSRGN
ncbi:hypothetical protein N665_0150s0005 [Sinapis alba]|nr:hypothetical protein N665_0150s0005 [Sinapis alba]